MTEQDFPTPNSDPEAEGVPAYADDDSFADPVDPAARVADGPSPAALPTDRPIAVEEFGTTGEEMRQGESLDLRLSREEPDPTAGSGRDPHGDTPDPAIAEENADPRLHDILEADDPATDSPVSVYERLGSAPDEAVGRIVEPDEGAHPDVQSEAIAYDSGSAGGGASAEELAVHRDSRAE
jgi:hypothetical protein